MLDEVIGKIVKFPFNYEPRGYMICKGQTLKVQFYAALYTLIGTTYGGIKDYTFNLPDLRLKDENGEYYRVGQIMKDGTPYMESFICIEGIYPTID